MNKPLVSVVISTHNRPELLEKAITSVYAQTFQDFEVIVVDDGDAPRAEFVVSEYIKKQNFRYIETKKNEGAPIARNRGIDVARGDLIAFLDDDDEWMPEKLETQLKAYDVSDKNKIGFVFSAVENVYENRSEITNVDESVRDYSIISLKRFNGFLTSSLLIPKKIIDEVDGFDLELPSHQEADLIIRISQKYEGIGINKPLLKMRMSAVDDHIGGDLTRRVAGRLKVLVKHHKLYTPQPQILASSYFWLGNIYRQLGDYQKSIAHFWKSFRLQKRVVVLLHIFRVINLYLLKKLKANRAELFVVSCATIFALIAAELSLRYLTPENVSVDPYLGELAPQENWDERGYRNPSVHEQADIVALGDSFTVGYNATNEESWPYVLGDLASSSVYQYAMGGFGPVQYAYLLPQAFEMRPKVVVVGFYFGNDIFDAHRITYGLNAWESLRDPSFQVQASQDDESREARLSVVSGSQRGTISFKIFELRSWLRDHSALYALLGNGTRGIRERIGVARKKFERIEDTKKLAESNPDLVFFYDDKNNSTLLETKYRTESIDLSQTITAEGWRITRDRLLHMQQLAEQAKIPLLILILPTKERIYVSYMQEKEEVVPPLLLEREGIERSLFKTVQAYCVEIDLWCVDALPGLVETLGSDSAVFPNSTDGHPNPPGYRSMAETAFDALKKKGILPGH